MKVKQLMSKHVVSVEMDDLLSSVKEIFEETNFHHLLVVDKGQLSGVISDRDLFQALSPKVDSVTATTKDLATLNKKAHQIMSHKAICLQEDNTVKEAIALFNTHNISCIPIICENKKPVGILSWRDIMQALGKSEH